VHHQITGPPRTFAGTLPTAVARLSARECVEPKSYRVALDNAQAPQHGVDPGIGYPGNIESHAYFGEIILSRK
jgi:hypothetical protein